jgi:SAM-dependent methyltransferase
MSDANFTRLYSAYVAQFTEDLLHWRSLAAASGNNILELGCGTGRVLAELAKWDFQVTGLDNDPYMLDWIRNNLPSHLQKHVNLIEADMRDFDLDQQFPLIIVPCNTFAYFNDVDSLEVLRCIRKHLTPNGQAIIVVPNPEKSFDTSQVVFEKEASQDEPVLVLIEPLSGNPVQIYAVEKPDFENKIIHVTWAFDELSPDGRVQRYQYEISYHMRSIEDTRLLIDNAGLSLRRIFGDYRYGDYGSSSDEVLFHIGL